MTNLTPLIDRVAGAGGADREIDLALQIAFGLPYATWGGKPVADWSDGSVPAYSESLDAALSLVARVLPGWSPGVAQNAHHAYWHAHVNRAIDGKIVADVDAIAPTPALALILAMLRAKQAETENG